VPIFPERIELFYMESPKAFVNRGIGYAQKGDIEKTIGDYSEVINLPEVPVDQKADALVFWHCGWR
jgi:hypothetical protein